MKNTNESLKRDEILVPFPERDTTMIPDEGARQLIPMRQTEELRERWTAIQSRFVDMPRKAVEEADMLVSSTIKQIEAGFLAERESLEKQWNRGEKISTEDLRLSLQHYREFFDRLLTQI
jgi:hypothetical protein